MSNLSFNFQKEKKKIQGTFPAIQCLRLHASTVGVTSLVPGGVLRSCMLPCGMAKKTRTLDVCCPRRNNDHYMEQPKLRGHEYHTAYNSHRLPLCSRVYGKWDFSLHTALYENAVLHLINHANTSQPQDCFQQRDRGF